MDLLPKQQNITMIEEWMFLGKPEVTTLQVLFADIYHWDQSSWDEKYMKTYFFLHGFAIYNGDTNNTYQVTSLVTEMQSPVEWKVVTN